LAQARAKCTTDLAQLAAGVPPGMILPGVLHVLALAAAAQAADLSGEQSALTSALACEANSSVLSLLQRQSDVLLERSKQAAQGTAQDHLEKSLVAKGGANSQSSPPPAESMATMYEYTAAAQPTYVLQHSCPDCTVRNNPNGHKQRQCGVVWFFHIPKCGGETVNWWLFRMKEQQEIDDVLLLHSMDEKMDYAAFEKEKLEPILQAPKGKLVAVHHHDRGPGLFNFNGTFSAMKTRLQAQGCDLYRMTFLREPRGLLKSTLVFFDSAEHQPKYEWVAPEPVRNIKDPLLRFKVGLETDAIYDNLMVRYILNNRCENDGPNPRCDGAEYPLEIGHVDSKALAEAWKILSTFEFVGFTEQMEAGAYTVSQELGFRNVVLVEKRNVYGVDQANMKAATSQRDFEALLSSEEIIPLVESRTAMDKELYEAAKNLSDKRHAGL